MPLLKTWDGTYVIASHRAPFFISKSWLETKRRQEQQGQQKQKRHTDSNSSSKDKQEE